MSEIDRNKAFDRAVDLVMHADRLTEVWTGRFVTIQGGLFTASGALLLWKGSDVSPWIVVIAATFVAAIGIIIACLLVSTIIREHEYGHCYIAMLKRIEGDPPWLFRDDDPRPPGPRFATTFRRIRIWLVVAWAGFIAAVAAATFAQ